MSLWLLLFTHLLSVISGGVLGGFLVLRYLRVREVDGEPMIGVDHEMKPSISTPLLTVIFSALLLLASIQCLIWTNRALDGMKDNDDRIDKIECEDAWLWIEALSRPPDPDDPKPSAAEKELIARFLDQKKRVVEDLNCDPPIPVTSG